MTGKARVHLPGAEILFVPWRRKPNTGYGHERILVSTWSDDGMLAPPAANFSEVQCYTIDRIPFCMKKARLLAVYEPEPKESEPK